MAFDRGGRNYRGIRPAQEMWTQNFLPIQQDKFIPSLRGRECGFWPRNVGLHCEPNNQNGFLPAVTGINNVNFGRPRPDFIPPMYDSKNNGNKTIPSMKTQTMRSLNGDIFTFPTSTGEPTTMSGVGELTWLSPKAGLITCKRTNKTVSFQTKDFCDQAVTDLTDVLCVGFTLCYQATASEASDHLIATNVTPLQGVDSEKEFFGSEEVDLEAAQARATSGPPRSPKDMYSIALESKAIPVILSVFKSQGGPFCQLSSLHSHICSTDDRELNRYIGTSSLKRRQFIEKRTHLFDEIQADQVRLQPPVVYETVKLLARYLLCRGGVTSTKSLYDFYVSCPELMEGRQYFEESDGHSAFVRLIKTHNWVFSLFPSQMYISVRRNLPQFDYADFVKKHLPNYAPSRRGIASSSMLNPITPTPLINSLSAASNVPLARPGSTMGADPVSRAFSVPQTTVNNLPSLPLSYNQQFPPKRATSVSNPPNNPAWSDMMSTVPTVNSLTDVPTANGFNNTQYGNEFVGEPFPVWTQARSYSTGSSPALSAASNQLETARKTLKDSSTQTDFAAKGWIISDEILRELCGGCAKRIASICSPSVDLAGLFIGLNLNQTPAEYRPISPSQFAIVSSASLPGTINPPALTSSNHMSNGVPSHKSSSSSPTSVVSPIEDVCSLSSGTPTTIEGSPEQEGRDYDPFNTLVFLESGRGLSNGIF